MCKAIKKAKSASPTSCVSEAMSCSLTLASSGDNDSALALLPADCISKVAVNLSCEFASAVEHEMNVSAKSHVEYVRVM